MHAGLFFNFNGTAGVWRRRCIEDAGGWSDDTLTEDLDLSYRAQLRGWRFAYAEAVEAPGELPADFAALRSQQRRWTRGAIQTARKLLPGLWRSPLPPRVKLEALVHLTGNAVYPLLLGLGVLLLPVIASPPSLPRAAVWTLQSLVIALGVLPVCVFLAAGRAAAGGGALRIARDVMAALLLGIGLSLNNAGAALAGLGPRLGDWERTPKSGDVTGRPAPRPRRSPSRGVPGGGELALAAAFVGVGVLAWRAAHPAALAFIALLVAGLGGVGLGMVRERRAGGRAPARERLTGPPPGAPAAT
jgi:hypothetical protein